MIVGVYDGPGVLVGPGVHDQYSHGADCFRYLSIVADEMVNESERKITSNFNTFGVTVSGMGG